MPPAANFVPADFFVLRTPLLPFTTFLQWGTDLQAPHAADQPAALASALAADRTQLRQRLRTHHAQAAIQEAIFVASPDLHNALARWHENPASEKGLRAERSLVRYWARMTGRATPFGLFSGCSLGKIVIGQKAQGTGHKAQVALSPTCLTLAPQATYQRHTRLDMDYLFALCETLGRTPALRAALPYFPNSSLYPLGGQLRYAEARLNGKARDYHLVVVEANDYLHATLARAQGGATISELAGALVAADPEITLPEAEGYLHELVDSQILVSSCTPAVSGREPIHGLIDLLQKAIETGQDEAIHKVTRALRATRDALAKIDQRGLGVEPARYLAIAERLQRLPTPVELGRLFQVDMVKPVVEATLGGAVLTEIQKGVQLLHRLAPPATAEQLTHFRERFVARYEGRQMALMEVLDEELGIGFRLEKGADHTPLLGGLNLPVTPAEATTHWGARQHLLLRKLESAWRSGAQTIELSEQEINALTNPTPAPLPASFAVMTTVAARSQSALKQGEFAILLDGISGPSGARLLGRFCHGDWALRQKVAAYLATEAAQEPDALYAEIIHLPEGRIGNVLCRPVLRQYEIPYWGQSGAAPETQIPVTDLMVSVVKGEIQLHSQRLQRRIIPRLTTAHNFTLRGQGVYMFLCALQQQNVSPGVRWDWGAFEEAAFLPRVTYKRLVFARARWRMNQAEIAQLGKLKDEELWRSVQAWSQQRNLPRFVVLTDADNELPVDLDNILSLESFIDTIKNRNEAILHELYPSPDELCVTAPEGAFVHELVVPFSQVQDPETRRQGDTETGRFAKRYALCAMRTFPPGSEWLYLKLYTGVATADRVLREVIAPVVRQAMASGAAHQWFFLRYADPDWHLRLRLRGDAACLLREVLPHLHTLATPWIKDGRIWKVQLDSYAREVERYGGVLGMELAERLFHADSEAVLSIVECLEGDTGADARWRLTYAGIDQLLNDLGFDLAQKQRLMRRARDNFQAEFHADSNLRSQLGEKHRQERQDLAWLLDPVRSREHPFAPGIEILRQRSIELRQIATELRTAEQSAQLTAPLHEIAWSYLHMHANRLLHSTQRAQELVLYDFLARTYETQLARIRTGEPISFY